ncbi:hypothetical protein TA3x_004174 [Tundrisphaera sp. TA3]|uniref:hypothetical protein n=1 Tax=Tundrisphaera sp. TA3 TaxID=3435775 RepID=UPI003EBE7731
MNIPMIWGWIWAILPGSREWALMAIVTLVLFGRSPSLRRRAVRWARPWRDGDRIPETRTLILVAVVTAALTASLMTWMQSGPPRTP